MAKEHKQVYSGSKLTLENTSGDVGKFQVDVNGDLVVTGNLNILGDLESTDVTQSTLQIDDKSIILNRGEQGPGVGAVPGTAPLSGLVIDRGMYEQTGTNDNGEPIFEFSDTPYTPATFLWNEVIKSWDFNTNLNTLDLDGNPNTVVEWQDRFTWDRPRVVNVGDPEGNHRTSELDTDPLLRGTAANVGFVADITNPIEINIDALEEYLNTSQSKTNNHIMYWNSSPGLTYGGFWSTEEMRIYYDKSPALGGEVDTNGYRLSYFGNYQDGSPTSSRATTYSSLYLGHTDGEDATYPNTTLWAETDLTIESNTSLVDIVAGTEIQLGAPLVDVNASNVFVNATTEYQLDTPLADINATTFDLDGTTGTLTFTNLTVNATTEYQLDTPLADINATALDADGSTANFNYTTSITSTSPLIDVNATTEYDLTTPLADINATNLDVDSTSITVDTNTYELTSAESIFTSTTSSDLISPAITVTASTEFQLDTPLADINATALDVDGATSNINSTTSFTLDTPLADINATTLDADGTAANLNYTNNITATSPLVDVNATTEYDLTTPLADINATTFDLDSTNAFVDATIEIQLTAPLIDVNATTELELTTPLADINATTLDVDSTAVTVDTTTYDLTAEQSTLTSTISSLTTSPSVTVNATTEYQLDTPLADINATAFDLDGTTSNINSTTSFTLGTPLADINATALDADGSTADLNYTTSITSTSPLVDVNATTEFDLTTPLADINATSLDVDGATANVNSTTSFTLTTPLADINATTEYDLTTPLADINATTFDLDGTNINIDGVTEIQLTAPTVDVNATSTYTLDTPNGDFAVADLDITSTSFDVATNTAYIDAATSIRLDAPTADLNLNQIDIDGINFTSTVSGTFTVNGTGDVVISPVGSVTVNDYAMPATDGSAGQSMVTDGLGNVTFQDAVNEATALETGRNIAVDGAVTGTAFFDGTQDITITTTATSDPTLTLAGDATGTATFTNLNNATLTVTVLDDSHNHVASNIDNFVEEVEDVVGGMLTGNTENGIVVTYRDADGTIDFNVNDPVITLNGDVSGSATMTNLSNTTITVTVADDSHNHVASNIDNFAEEVEDVVGAMVTGGTEDGISVTYNDAAGLLNFDIDGTVVRTFGNQTITGTKSFSETEIRDGSVNGALPTTSITTASTLTDISLNWSENLLQHFRYGGSASTNNVGATVFTRYDSDNILTIDYGSGVAAGEPTGGLRGIGTINAEALYNNGVLVANSNTNLIAGTHLTGGGTLATNRTFNVTPDVNTYFVDSQGNNRMYFGSTTSTNQFIFRFSSTGDFEWRDSGNNIVATVDQAGNASFNNITANGSSLTNIDASEITTGTLSDARLPNTITSNITGNAATANALATARTISLGGEFSGSASFDGSSNITISGSINNFAERVQDVAGGMVSSNSEAGIAVTYNDATGKLDFNVNDPTITLSGHVSGSATMTNLGNTTINTVVNTIDNQASTASGNISFFLNDGGGNSGLRFNATPGASNTLIENGIAYEIDVGNDSTTGDFVINRGTTSTGTSGEAITWQGGLIVRGSDGQVVASQGFTGNGAGLTALNASNITTGTISDARLPNTISSSITGTAANANLLDNINSTQFLRSDVDDTHNGNLNVSGILRTSRIDTDNQTEIVINVGESANYFTGQGSEILYVNAESGLQINSSPDNWTSGWAGRRTTSITPNGITTDGIYTGNGSGLTTLNASNISSGTINDARLPGTITSNITGNAATATNATNANTASTAVRVANSISDGTSVNAVFTSVGSDGAGIEIGSTGTDQGYMELFTQDNGSEPIYVRQYQSGSVARTATLLNNVGNTVFPNNVTAASFSGNGSTLTSLNASNISSGTISDARLPSTISSSITGNAATATTATNATNANNANLLDNINSTQFLRSDTSDTMSGNLTVTGQVTAGSFNTSSALKYKENVVDFDNALEKVMQIDTIYYTPKSGPDKSRKIGVTADSVAKVAPEFVDFVNGEPDSVNYGQMTAMLIKAIQEQEERRLVNKVKKVFSAMTSWFKK